MCTFIILILLTTDCFIFFLFFGGCFFLYIYALFFLPSVRDSVDIQKTPLCDPHSCGGDTTKQGCCQYCLSKLERALHGNEKLAVESAGKSCCIPTFDTDVTYIDLRRNNIKEITVASFAGLTSLEELHLQENLNLEFVQIGSFDDLFNITEIWVNSMDKHWKENPDVFAAATDACNRARAQGASLSKTRMCSLVYQPPGANAYLYATGSFSAVVTIAAQYHVAQYTWNPLLFGLAMFDVFTDFGVYAFVTQRPDFDDFLGEINMVEHCESGIDQGSNGDNYWYAVPLESQPCKNNQVWINIAAALPYVSLISSVISLLLFAPRLFFFGAKYELWANTDKLPGWMANKTVRLGLAFFFCTLPQVFAGGIIFVAYGRYLGASPMLMVSFAVSLFSFFHAAFTFVDTCKNGEGDSDGRSPCCYDNWCPPPSKDDDGKKKVNVGEEKAPEVDWDAGSK